MPVCITAWLPAYRSVDVEVVCAVEGICKQLSIHLQRERSHTGVDYRLKNFHSENALYCGGGAQFNIGYEYVIK